VGMEKKIFIVHENLICVSPYFRDILQPRRKTIEGTCSICHEVLDPNRKELTYCSKSCGNNFHLDCIRDWHEYTPSEETSKCPMCRQDWVRDEYWGGVYELPDINANAFHIYTEWLYKSTISEEFDAFALMRAYLFGENDICDLEFCHDVLCAIIAMFLRVKVSTAFIRRVYDLTNITSPLRAIVVGLYTQLPSADLILALSTWEPYQKGYLPEFLADLARTLALKGADPPVAWEYEVLKYKLLTCPWAI
jgi:hypothetical protein